MPAINWLAVIAAALSMFVLGAVWYSPILFLERWTKAAGLTIEVNNRRNFPMILGISFVLTLIMAANLALFVYGLDLGTTIAYAVAAGLGWAALSLWVISLFESRPFAYVLINGGYLTVGFALMGLILGLWR
ncbi:MAG: DUF1761 domain-containing protein [Devosia sp.]